MTNQAILKRAFTEGEAAHYIELAAATLRQGRCHGKREGHTPVPKHIKIGRSVRYLKEDLDAFLDEMRENTNQTNGGVE
jgi:hypothetical protein